MTAIRAAIIAIAFTVAALPASARDLSIANAGLRVTVHPESNSFDIRSLTANRTFVKQATCERRISSAERTRVTDPVWGPADQITLRHADEGSTTLRLYENSPFLHLQTTIHNPAPQPRVTASEHILTFSVDLGLPVEQLKSYGTGFLNPVDKAPGSFAFTAVVDPDTRRGMVAACLTHDQGSGVFFTSVADSTPKIDARLDFGRYQIEPGASRTTETILIGCFDDARLGLEAYADAVAKQYAIKPKPQPSVYCTWYHAGASNESKLLDNARFARDNLAPFGFSVVQIDDHWQARFARDNKFTDAQKNFKGEGPVKNFFESNDNFPHGMAYIASQLHSMHLVPGIWFMPFAGTWNNPHFADKQDLFAHWPDGKPIVSRWSGTLLDLTNPKTQTFVYDRTKRIYDWGFRYFKIDGMHTGAVTHNVYVNTGYATSGSWRNSRNFIGQQAHPGSVDSDTPSTALHDPTMTHIQAYRKGLQILRKAAPDAFILGCNVSQNMRSMAPAFGLIDAMRIGPDNGSAGSGRWSAVMTGPQHGTNLYFLNKRIWHNDPDPVYVRPSNPIESARLMASWVAVSGSMLTTSYQFADLPADRLDIIKRTMPGYDAVSRPVDLFESPTARIWLLTKGPRNVIGLFNWNEKQPETITYDMGRLGLDDKTTYVAFDFWADKFIDPITTTLSQTLPARSCRVLAVRPAADHPQLLSTSRHITQGVVDVLEENWNARTATLSGTSLVVAGDPYELRIALPAGADWKIARTSADGAEIKVTKTTYRGVRVLINSRTSRKLSWKVTFDRPL